MDEIEQILAQAESDATEASDSLIGLTTQFGSDRLLLEMVAECNLRRQQIALQRNRVGKIRKNLTTESLVELQLILVQVSELKDECSRLKALSEELKRND